MDYLQAKRQAEAELSERRNKPVSELVPWQDYDPIMLDNRVRELMNPSVRFSGD